MADAEPCPELTVIVPVYNGGATLSQCLAAVAGSAFRNYELIVVDDGSTDESFAVAQRFTRCVIRFIGNEGPEAARNCAARHASGRILFFLDADVQVQPETLGEVRDLFEQDAELTALFGSCEIRTPAHGFLSRYKNLSHYYTHQVSSEKASTFCGGFGAIRAEIFFRLGGFNPEWRFREDIEFGYRLHTLGMRVELQKQLQLTPCKHYSLAGLIRSDLFRRAAPWTLLMFEAGHLRTRWKHVLGVSAAALLVAPGIGFIARGSALAAFAALNFGFFKLAWREYGPRFALLSAAMVWLGSLYGAARLLMEITTNVRTRVRRSWAE